MSVDNRFREGVDPLRWPAWALAALLAFGILFGGGGAEGQFNNGIILAAATVALCAICAAHWAGARRLPASATIPVCIILAFLLIGTFQLIPVPPALWRSEPGRDVAKAALQLVGSGGTPRALSLDPDASRRALAALLLPTALMLGVIGATRREVRLFLYVILACALASAIIGALQLALNYPAWLSFYEGGTRGAAAGVFANVNHHASLLLAAILCVGIAVRLNVLAGYDFGRRRWKFDPTWLLVPIFAVVILATGSRAALLLLILAVPVCATIGLGRTSVRLLLAALLGVGVVILVLSELAPSGNQVAIGQSLMVSQDKRYAILPDVWFTLRQFWPIGSGLGTFAQVFALNEDLDLAGFAYVNHAHNDLLEFVLETGLIGLIWLILAAAAILARLVFVQVKDRSGRSSRAALVWGGFFILALLGLHSVADYPLRTPAVAAIAGVGLGLIFAPERQPARRVRARPLVAACFGLAAVAALFVGTETFRAYAAQAAVRSGKGALAIRLDRANGGGLALAAEAALQAHHVEQARALASEAIRRAPLSAPAVRVLALSQDIQNRGGMQAWRLASSMGWRDPPTQFWAMQQALLNHEYATAAIRADALLRTSSDPTRQRIAAIQALANLAPFRGELIRRLLLEPRWADSFFVLPAKASVQQLQGVYLTLTDLARGGNRVTPAEARSTIQALIDRKQFPTAVELDQAVTKRDSTDSTPNLEFADDDDHYAFNATPFDWNFVDRGGTTISVEQSGSQRVLELGTDGRHLYQLARKYVPLASGRYTLGYSIRGDAKTAAAFRIGLYCPGERKAFAASAADPLAESGFVHREFQFAVPSGCPIVLLAFDALPAEGPAEAQFTDLSLGPI